MHWCNDILINRWIEKGNNPNFNLVLVAYLILSLWLNNILNLLITQGGGIIIKIKIKV